MLICISSMYECTSAGAQVYITSICYMYTVYMEENYLVVMGNSVLSAHEHLKCHISRKIQN